jgi:carbamoyl-phosphate synthase small subunit
LSQPALLALEDGSLFYGVAIGAEGISVGEVVFNTAMTGYQEILTDPSYAQQIVTLTYPHIGNVGVNDEDSESERVWAAGLVIRELSLLASNWRSQTSLDLYLRRQNVVAIAQVDTRRLTHLLRNKGALKGCIVTGDFDPESALQTAREFPGLEGMDLAKEVSTQEIYIWTEGSWHWPSGYKKFSPDELQWHVVVYDFGVKRSILRMLVDRGCRLTVVPAQTHVDEILALKPDGIFLSNGPGDPAVCDYAIQAISTLLQYDHPVFGICLGHQLLALGSGAKTVKMKFGHHGANHPVVDDVSKRVFITSQNHGFAVAEATLPPFLQATHRSLFDGSLQGIRHTKKPLFGFQGHPEASPGPHDVQDLFDQFIELIKHHRKENHA